MSNRPKPNFKGSDTSNKKAIQLLLSFLESHIQTFWENSKHKSDIIEKEDVLTEMLHHHLMQNAKTQNFYFTPQAIQAEGKRGTFRKVDIGVSAYSNTSLPIEVSYFFVIEAKYLPSEDYVVDDYAAIKRFKANEHGIKSKFDKLPLSENAIVAYVKSGNFEDHFEKINNEIQELSNQFSSTKDKFGLIWQESEKLTPKYPPQNDKYESKHKRINYPNSTVQLHHFWVKVTK